MTDRPSPQSLQRDLWFSLPIAIIIGAPIVYFDIRLYGSKVIEHLPDHLLAIIAILAGVIAVRYERKLDKAFERQKTELSGSFEDQKKRIEQIISTKFLGEWPSHLKEITSLVGSADPGDELLIAVDSFGYGHFSYAGEFNRFFSALERAMRSGVKIKFLLHSEKASRDCLVLQIEKQYGEAFDELKNKLIDYQKAYPQLIDSLPSFLEGNTPEFREKVMTLALYVQNSLCRQLNDAVTGEPVDVHVALKPSIPDAVFFWMIRRQNEPKQLVFAYPKYAGVGTGYGFQTYDTRLMDIFSRQFDTKFDAENGETIKIKPGHDVYPEAAAELRNRKQNGAGRADAAPAS